MNIHIYIYMHSYIYIYICIHSPPCVCVMAAFPMNSPCTSNIVMRDTEIQLTTNSNATCNINIIDMCVFVVSL